MKKGLTIGFFASLAALATGLYWAARKPDGLSLEREGDAEDTFMAGVTAPPTPSHRFQDDDPAADRQRWGTRPGVIDVANDRQEATQQKQRLQRTAAQGQELTRKAWPAVLKRRALEHPQHYSAFYRWLDRHFHSLQVTLTNRSAQEREIRLWGGHREPFVSPPAPEEVEALAVTREIPVPPAMGAGRHPQAVLVNPANGFTYVANQLSDNVTVLNAAGNVVALVPLSTSLLPGANSPVALAVNTDPNSPHYGEVYVAGSVANTVSIIDPGLEVVEEVAVGPRPMSLAFHPFNGKLYVVSLVENTLSILNPETRRLEATVPTSQDPFVVATDPVKGDLYIAHAMDGTVHVLNAQAQAITTLAGLGQGPSALAYHPGNATMNVVFHHNDALVPIDTTTYTPKTPVPTGPGPFTVVYNPNNQYLYVGNRADDTITVIAPDASIRATLSLGPVNIGLAVDRTTGQLWTSHTAADRLQQITYVGASRALVISESYPAAVEEFSRSPAVVKHVKWVMNGPPRFPLLRVVNESQEGTRNTLPMSLQAYRSPQNFLNVAEMTALDGAVIDGANSWWFSIGGGQTITVIVYFQQVNAKTHVPELFPPLTPKNL